MRQSSFKESQSRSAPMKTFNILQVPNVYYRSNKNLPVDLQLATSI
jgi:hypothetical protein